MEEKLSWFKNKNWGKISGIFIMVLAAIQPLTTMARYPVQMPLWTYEFLIGAAIYWMFKTK